MALLIPLGTGLTLIGLVILVGSMVAVARARRAGLSEEALRAKLQRIVAINFAGLAVSALGLMMVVIGMALG